MTITLGERTPTPRVEELERLSRRRFTAQQWWGAGLFVGLLGGYLAVGTYLYLVVGYINPDASSRVANAAFTIWSRDRHLAAVGFVWNPLPSLVELPLVELTARWPLNQWPELRRVGFAGAVMSAFFMAGAAWQVRRIALDYNCGAVLRWIAVAAFALNPMVVLYAGMGMSEAPFLFLLLWTCRRILLWINRFAVIDLVVAGVALGLAYLTRYEALPAAAGVALGVFVVSTMRNRPDGRTDWAAWRAGAPFGVHDATIVAMPAVFAFVVWAVAGWLLDGNAFSQFSSQYGNSSQVAAAGIISVEDVGAGPLAEVIVGNLLGMQPLLAAVVVIVGWLAIRSRRLDAAVVGVVFGSVLLFQTAAVIMGSTFGWFRFYMAATPLVVVLILVAGSKSPSRSRPLLPEVRGAQATGSQHFPEVSGATDAQPLPEASGATDAQLLPEVRGAQATSLEGPGEHPRDDPSRLAALAPQGAGEVAALAPQGAGGTAALAPQGAGEAAALAPQGAETTPAGWRRSRPHRSLSSDRSSRRSRIEGPLTALMALVLATSFPVTVTSMLNPALGREEYGLRSAFWPEKYPKSDFWFYWFGDLSRNVARWFDDQALPPGSVLVDTFGVSRVWLFSDNPEQFVIRSDFDFFAKLNEPAARKVQYIMTLRPTGLGRLDAINVRYPTLWEDGAGIATLQMTITTPNGTPQFRVYRIND